MPIVIGAKPESKFTDPIGLLTDCHRRIERFLRVLVEVAAQARGGPLSGEQRKALDAALRYFREAAPKHTADEEQSLFPRLRPLFETALEPEMKAVLRCVEALERDHARANEGHAEIDRLGQIWLVFGSLSTADAERFCERLVELAEFYRDHIAVEEREVFPVAARLLGEPQQAAIGSEMAARRGVSWATPSETPMARSSTRTSR
jgi:hemerythrin-like domain-containing protein